MSVSLDRIGVPAALVVKTPALPSANPADPVPTESTRPSQARRFGDDPDAIACTCNTDPWDATTARVEDLLERAKPVFSHLVLRTAANGLRGFSTALQVLAQYPGDTWQERWNASPAGREPEWLIEAIQATGRQRTAALQGQLALLVLGPVRPSSGGLVSRTSRAPTPRSVRSVTPPVATACSRRPSSTVSPPRGRPRSPARSVG